MWFVSGICVLKKFGMRLCRCWLSFSVVLNSSGVLRLVFSVVCVVFLMVLWLTRCSTICWLMLSSLLYFIFEG